MNGPQFGFLKITEPVEHVLPFLRPEHEQDMQDFSFAQTQTLR